MNKLYHILHADRNGGPYMSGTWFIAQSREAALNIFSQVYTISYFFVREPSEQEDQDLVTELYEKANGEEGYFMSYDHRFVKCASRQGKIKSIL